ncbi:MAG: hypothetical protein AAF222_10515 [Pseudomonadota bacterium]
MARHALLVAFLASTLVAGAGKANADTLQDRIAAAPDGSFEAGTYQTLASLERLLQGMQQYGIGQGFGQFMGVRGRDLVNTRPDTRAPDTFRTLLDTFLDDLDAARTTLGETTPDTAEPFVADIGSLWVDINRNGQEDATEGAARVLAMALPQRRGQADVPDAPIEVRFDGADHAWLTAYTHVMSATANMVLAFDPTPIFADLLAGESQLADLPTIENTYDPEALQAEIDRLKVEQDRLKALANEIGERRAPLSERLRALSGEIRQAEDDTTKATLQAERDALNDRLRNDPALDQRAVSRSLRFTRQQMNAIEAKLPRDPSDPRAEMRAAQMAQFNEPRNAIYALIKALEQQPDGDRLAQAERHWREMLRQNRLFWDLVAQETDNDREWVPNATQTSALGLQVTQDVADAWQAVLADGEALLDGRLLIRHPLLPEDVGVSVARWLEDPTPLDIAGWVHGRAAYPYLARGPMMTAESWLELQRLTGGNGMGFAIFLN